MTQKLHKSHLNAAYNIEIFKKSQHGTVETSVSTLLGQSLSSFEFKVQGQHTDKNVKSQAPKALKHTIPVMQFNSIFHETPSAS